MSQHLFLAFFFIIALIIMIVCRDNLPIIIMSCVLDASFCLLFVVVVVVGIRRLSLFHFVYLAIAKDEDTNRTDARRVKNAIVFSVIIFFSSPSAKAHNILLLNVPSFTSISCSLSGGCPQINE